MHQPSSGHPAFHSAITVILSNVRLGCMILFFVPALLFAQEPCDLTLEITQATCPFDDDASITVVGAPGDYQYYWDHDPFISDATAEDLPPGSYSVVAVGLSGCVSYLEAVVMEPVVPPLGTITTTDITCAGNNDGTVTFTLNPDAPTTWQWLHDISETNTTLTNLGPGVYGVRILNDPDCPSIVTGALGDPEIMILGVPDYCPSDPPLLTTEPDWGFQPHLFLWSTGETTSSLQVTAGMVGPLEITAVDTISGCVSTAEVVLNELPSPYVVFSTPDSACQHHRFMVNTIATDADSLVWRWQGNGISHLAEPIVSFSQPYWQPISLQGFDAFGCGNLPVHDSIYIHPLKPATFTVEQIPCSPVVEIDLKSIADSCAFFIGDSLMINDCYGFNVIDLRRYQDYEFTFIATQTNNCNDTVVVTLDVRTEPTMFLPSAFTPNGDGLNDEWPGPVDLPELSYELRIYDRWGTNLWSTNDPDAKWNGDDLPMGVYVYTMRHRDPCQLTNEVATKGHFMLLR